MKTKNFLIVCLSVFLSVGVHGGYSQASFINLDFEHPILPLVPDARSTVPMTNAAPGWHAYVGGSEVDRIAYNTVGLGGAVISFHDTASLFPPVQGDYSVMLQPSSALPPTAVAMAQIGQVPLMTRSLLFYGSPTMQVTFAGQPISLITLGITSRYYFMGADISAFAGQTGELRFLQPSLNFGTMVIFDDIQFSSQPVPEPGVFALLGVGLVSLLLWRRARANL